MCNSYSCARPYTHEQAVQIVQLLHGITQGRPTLPLAREMGVDRKHLLIRRHHLQELAARARPDEPLPDHAVEADEMYQNAGEKRRSAPRSRRSAAAAGQLAAASRRGDKARGHGTWENDRPPILGVLGRDTRQVHLAVTVHGVQARIS